VRLEGFRTTGVGKSDKKNDGITREEERVHVGA